MHHNKFLIVIGGATASGKSALALDLALHYKTEIISADSRQFYKEMNIGTAKPKPRDLSLVPHHFVDFLSVLDSYSAGMFERDALSSIHQLLETRNTALLVGGSGLFIRAVCEGFDEFPDIPAEISRELEEIHLNRGIGPLQEKLRLLDPDYFRTVDLNNPRRLIRALSVCIGTGKPFSTFFRLGNKVDRGFAPIYIQLQVPREELYEMINQRVDQMLEAGLIDEARLLFRYRNLPALQTVGYQELFLHFDGHISLDEAIEKIKQNTRNYAKRQETWFRKHKHWKALSPSDVSGAIRYIDQFIAAKHGIGSSQ
jgi:tRNA dimethylallyltransferase